MLPIRLRRAVAALTLSLVSATAAAACTDRLAPADRPPDLPARLPELVYDCLTLADGRALWVGETGRQHGTTVLLVHGLGHAAHRDWRRTIAPLAARFHVVALDLPGFGASEALPDGHGFDGFDRTLDELVARLGRHGRAHVVGHSLGGAVSLNFAHRHPDRVDRLVLVDVAGILLPNLYGLPPRVALPETGFPPVDRLMRRLDANLNGVSRGLAGRIDDRVDLVRWLRANPAVRDALIGASTQVDAAIHLVAHDFGPAVREVRAPTTLVWGRDDPVAPLRTGRLLAARMPQARLEVIHDTGHVPMLQAPARFVERLMPALEAPLEPRDVTVPGLDAPGVDTRCDAEVGTTYTGRLGRLALVDCQGVVVRDARLDALVLRNASVVLDNVTVVSDGTALDARNSHVVATNVDLTGRIALRADDSMLDLAGARLHASERGVAIGARSWLYFSIGEIDAPDHRGPVHLAWPTAANLPPANR